MFALCLLGQKEHVLAKREVHTREAEVLTAVSVSVSVSVSLQFQPKLLNYIVPIPNEDWGASGRSQIKHYRAKFLYAFLIVLNCFCNCLQGIPRSITLLSCRMFFISVSARVFRTCFYLFTEKLLCCLCISLYFWAIAKYIRAFERFMFLIFIEAECIDYTNSKLN